MTDFVAYNDIIELKTEIMSSNSLIKIVLAYCENNFEKSDEIIVLFDTIKILLRHQTKILNILEDNYVQKYLLGTKDINNF